jgi:hypothetical protein
VLAPDLAPVDYFRFPKLKFPLKGRHFQTIEEIQSAVTRELNNISKTAFLEGMKLKERANKRMIKDECILKSKNRLCLFKKLSLFYKSCLKTFGSHLVLSSKNSPPPKIVPFRTMWKNTFGPNRPEMTI